MKGGGNRSRIKREWGWGETEKKYEMELVMG
jgi:hypothetical protein